MIYAVLDENQNIVTYSETGGVALSESDYMEQLRKPGVYKWTGAAFAYEPYKPREPTAGEITEAAETVARRAKTAAVETVAEMQAETMAKTATPKQLKALKPLFPTWESLIGKPIDKAVTPYIRYGELIYNVISNHTAAANWTPGAAVSLYIKVAEPGTVAPWVQPLGAHDIYNKPGSGLPKSDPVTHKGEIWISLINSNSWEPGAVGSVSLWTIYKAADNQQ